MGQHCSRDGQINAIGSKGVSDSHLKQNIGTSNDSAINRKALIATPLTEILERLDHDQLLMSLAMFRAKCREERATSNGLAFDKVAGHKTSRISWKRLTLRNETLYSMFPSLQSKYIQTIIAASIQILPTSTATNQVDDNRRFVCSMCNEISLFDTSNLASAFHIAGYLFQPDNLSSNKYKQEILFQDFAVALSIILKGTREEQLIFLFLLFADAVVPATVEQPAATASDVGGGVKRDMSRRFGLNRFASTSNVGRDNTNKATNPTDATDLPQASGIASSTGGPSTRKRSYTDPHHKPHSASLGGISSTIDIVPNTGSRSNFLTAMTTANTNANGHMTSSSSLVVPTRTRHASFEDVTNNVSSSDAKLQSSKGAGEIVRNDAAHTSTNRKYVDNKVLSGMALSESAVYKLVLFVHMCSRYSPYTALAKEEASEVGSSDDENKATNNDEHTETQQKEAVQFGNEVVNLLTKIHGCNTQIQNDRSGGGSSNSQSNNGVDFETFMTLLMPTSTLVNTNNSSNSGIPVSFVTSGSGTLMLAKTVGNSQNSLRLSDEMLNRILYVLVNDLVTNPYAMLKRTCDFFVDNAKQNELDSALDLIHNDVLATHPLSDYKVFVMDASWWNEWCKSMEVKSLFHTADGPHDDPLLALLVKGVENIGDKRGFKHTRCGAFHCDPALAQMPRLRNDRLVVKDDLGVYRLRAFSDGAVPTADQNAFVLLPYELGVMLYNQFDKHAQRIPPEIYCRRLNFCSSAVPSQDTPRGQLTSSVNNFITNFYAYNCAFFELNPHFLPIYFCNASGLANTRFTDILTVRSSDVAHSLLNKGVLSSLTVDEFLSSQKSKYMVMRDGADLECRLWGLYVCDQHKLQTSPSGESVLCHTSRTEWRLLNDRQQDLFVLSRQTTDPLVGIMVEFMTVDRVWPTSRVLPIVYTPAPSPVSSIAPAKSSRPYVNGVINSTIVTSDCPNDEDLRGLTGSTPNSARSPRGVHLSVIPSTMANATATPRQDIYQIGMLVDVLTEKNFYCEGVVQAVLRDLRTDHSVALSVTVKLVLSELFGAVNGGNITVPYYSPRILPRGCVTGLRSTVSQSSTMGSAVALVPVLIDVTDIQARSAYLLALDQSVAVNRTVLPKKLVSEVSRVVQQTPESMDVVAPVSITTPTDNATQKDTPDQLKISNSQSSLASVSADEEADDENANEEEEEGEGHEGDKEGNHSTELSKAKSNSSILSDKLGAVNEHNDTVNGTAVNTNGEHHSKSISSNGSVGSTHSNSKGTSMFVSAAVLSRSSSTVIPLSVDVAAATSELSPNVVEVNIQQEGADAAPTVVDQVAHNDEHIFASSTSLPSTTITISADLTTIIKILTSRVDAPNVWPCTRLLYDIVGSEQHCMLASGGVVYAVTSSPVAYDTAMLGNTKSDGTVPTAAVTSCDDMQDNSSTKSDRIVIRNMDTNRSLTESGHSTDTAGTQNTESGSNPFGDKKSNRFRLRSISRACTSLSKLLSLHSRPGNAPHRQRGVAGEAYARKHSVAMEMAGLGGGGGEAQSSANSRMNRAVNNNSVVTSGVVSNVGSCSVVMTTVGLCGLNNLGNTCFLSSALQCLTKTPIFILYFLTQQYRSDINIANNLGSKGKVTEEFARFLMTNFNLNSQAGGHSEATSLFNKNFRHLKHNYANNANKFDSMSPTALLKAFQVHKPYFTGADQQDAQEFLSELLDTFHEDLKMKKVVTPAVVPPPVQTSDNPVHSADSDNSAAAAPPTINKEMSISRIMEQGHLAWQQYTANNNSVVSSLFQGQLCNKVTCKVCSTVSLKFEPFTTLSLSIPKMKGGANVGGSSDSVTVIATVFRKMPRLFLLKQFQTRVEEINEENKDAEGAEDNQISSLDWNNLLHYYSLCSKPARIAVSVHRHATVHDIKAKVIEAVNAMDSRVLLPAGDAPNDSVLSSLPPLTQLHTTAIDVTHEEKGRIKKILESRENLYSLIDDFQNEFHILFQENNKNIPFISTLPSNRLNPAPRTGRKIDPSRDWRLLCIGYSDELEYHPQHFLYNNDIHREGKLVADLDHTYDRENYLQFHPRHNPHGRQRQGSQQEHESSSHEKRSVVVNHFDSSVDWPSTLDQFVVGDRVDALDHKGTWFSGSVLDVYHVTEADIESGGLTKHARDSKGQNSGNVHSSRSPTSANTVPTRTRLTPGVHIRVHFDNFSSIWDEWYDQTDYERGYLHPIFTKTVRKLKIFDMQLVHRRLLRVSNTPPQSPSAGSPHTDDDDASSKSSELRIDIFDVPVMLQTESYRSLRHVYKHVVEQLMRFMTPDEVSALVNSPATGDEPGGLTNLPFTLRLISSNNLFAPPLDESSISSVVATTGHEVGTGESYHRFYDFKYWEGTTMPMDVTRPVANIFHSRLLIAVDWFKNSDFAVNEEAVITAPLRRSLATVDDESYTKYVAQVYQKQQATLLAQQMTAVTAPIANTTESQRFKDNRAGLNIEELLSNFVGVEDLDEYYCETCKKLCPGLVHTSLQLLPDILILHLKRLVMNATGGGKIRTLVKFPLNDLDMCPYTTDHLHLQQNGELYSNNTKDSVESAVTTVDQQDTAVHAESAEVAASDTRIETSEITTESNNDDAKVDVTTSTASEKVGVGVENNNRDVYELYGVVNHLGGMYGGHYTAFANCEHIALPASSASSSNNVNGNASGATTNAESSASKTNTAGTTSGSGVVSKAKDTIVDKEEEEVEVDSSMSSHAIPPAMSPLTLQEYVIGAGVDIANSANQQISKKKWLKFDDEFVLEVGNSNSNYSTNVHNNNSANNSNTTGSVDTSIVTESAYLLFYQRKTLSAKNIIKYF